MKKLTLKEMGMEFMSRWSRFLTFLAISLVSVSQTFADGKGQGAIVIRNTDRDGLAPIYVDEKGDRLAAKAERGDYVGGITTMGPVHQYQFERKKNGRVHVTLVEKGKQRAVPISAWMDGADLETFTYECGCGFGGHQRGREEEACSPFKMDGFVTKSWNACFEEARDKKLGELKTRWDQEATGSAKSEAKPETKAEAKATATIEKPLTNDAVIEMVKAGLEDELIVAKIKQVPAVDFDVSADALIRLKKAGASKAQIDALMKRAGEPKAK